jgi:alpha-tubulin suppressor-like RCC1 family protein
VRAIAAGGDHTCALTQVGGVLCWGDNSYGQLGIGTVNETYPLGSSTPVAVVELSTGVSAIATGEAHTCALIQAGGVQCWGHNWYGQVGNGIVLGFPPPDDVRPSPVAVVGLSAGVNVLETGGWHTCVLTQAGTGQCWGSNSSGQLGDGEYANSSTPVDVGGLPPE